MINALTNNNKLAQTSASPGKTKLINHFLINDNWYLVDLPGYGYAKTSKNTRSAFEGIILDYLTKREHLTCLFALIDIRLSIQQIDAEFLQWLGEKEIPFCIVFTKCDKLSKNELNRNLQAYLLKLGYIYQELPNYILTSSVNGMGRDEILELIQETIKPANHPKGK